MKQVGGTHEADVAPDRRPGLDPCCRRSRGRGPGKGASSVVASPLPSDEDARIVHALNRLAYGPRPGDLETVRKMGLEPWIDRQLHPEGIADEGLAPRLAGLPTLRLSSGELMKGYEIPREARREIAKRKAELGANSTEAETAQARRELMEKYRGDMAGAPRDVLDQLQAAKVLRAVYSERQLDEVAGRLLDEPLQRLRQQGTRPVPDRRVRARRRSGPRAWGKFEDLLKATAAEPGHAVLPGQLALLGSRRGRPARRRRGDVDAAAGMRRRMSPTAPGGSGSAAAASTRTTPARSWSSTPWASTAATPRRTSPRWRAASRAGPFAACAHQRPELRLRRSRARLQGDKVVLGHRIAGGGQGRRRRGPPHPGHPSRDRPLRLARSWRGASSPTSRRRPWSTGQPRSSARRTATSAPS